MSEESSYPDASQSRSRSNVVCINNTLPHTFNYFYRWADETEWTRVALKQNYHHWHSSQVKQKFYIKFDHSFADGYVETSYYLTTYSNRQQCDGAKTYNAVSTGQKFDLKGVN